MAIRTCAHCGGSFKNSHARVQCCSRACSDALRKATTNTILQSCPGCGTTFEVSASRLKHGRGVHCSPACQYATNRVKLAGERVGFTCEGCGCVFERNTSYVKNRKGVGQYCSRKCRDAYRVGALHPQWLGIETQVKRYGPHWQAIRRAARNRDGKCMGCGAEKGLHVHHQIPFRLFLDRDEANALSNLVALCAKCHRHADVRAARLVAEQGLQEWSLRKGTWEELLPLFRVHEWLQDFNATPRTASGA